MLLGLVENQTLSVYRMKDPVLYSKCPITVDVTYGLAPSFLHSLYLSSGPVGLIDDQRDLPAVGQHEPPAVVVVVAGPGRPRRRRRRGRGRAHCRGFQTYDVRT